MDSAAAVGNALLELGWSDRSVPAVTQMKLQKLLFYGHAWNLAINGSPLFEEDFEAWPWGPVVRDVYSQTAKYGRLPIDSKLVRVQLDKEGRYEFVIPEVSSVTTNDFIKSVWDVHKRFTGVQLSNSTHAPGEPWTVVKEAYGSLDSKPTIPNDLIQQIFAKKLAKAKNVAT